MLAKIYITLKKSILDPQGKAILHSLENLGFSEINEVRIGKMIEVKLNTKSKEDGEKIVENICKKLLVNPVMETYTYELIEEK